MLTILGHRYFIKQDIEADVAQALGVIDNHKGIIHIAAGLDPDRQASVLLHEIIEALDDFLELNLDHRTISALGVGLFQVLADNHLLQLVSRDELRPG